jgi:hypothetical protein
MKAVHAKTAWRSEADGERVGRVLSAAAAGRVAAECPRPGVLSSPLWRFPQRPGNASTSSGT